MQKAKGNENLLLLAVVVLLFCLESKNLFLNFRLPNNSIFAAIFAGHFRENGCNYNTQVGFILSKNPKSKKGNG
ncbi:MAG: hypothetical protein IT262_18845 [Saprospiraceae bacterium]|nr:hypothetical protein [Saprospiraceae bacterium]